MYGGKSAGEYGEGAVHTKLLQAAVPRMLTEEALSIPMLTAAARTVLTGKAQDIPTPMVAA